MFRYCMCSFQVLTFDDEYKFKVWNVNNQTCRATALAPTYGGTVCQMTHIPSSTVQVLMVWVGGPMALTPFAATESRLTGIHPIDAPPGPHESREGLNFS